MHIGIHIIADLYGVENNIFKKVSQANYYLFNNYIESILQKNNMNLLNSTIHHFNTLKDLSDNNVGAFTALYLLSESHLSLHSWPEKNYIAIDAFTCGTCDTEQLIKDIILFFNPQSTKCQKINRGDQLLN